MSNAHAAHRLPDEAVAPPPPEAAPPAAPAEPLIGQRAPAGPHPLTTRAVLVPLALLLGVLSLPFLHLLVRGEAKAGVALPFADDFERSAIGPGWHSTGGHWRLQDGWLHSPGVRNNPLWLEARLPAEVVVEFDVRSASEAGDIKFEIFGDGRNHASGYVLIFGGWNNSISTIARLDEHGRDRVERKDRRVEKDRAYRFRVERRSGRLDWYIDGEPFLSFDDRAPLSGRGHDRFGVSSWNADVYFDNLRIAPLQ